MNSLCFSPSPLSSCSLSQSFHPFNTSRNQQAKPAETLRNLNLLENNNTPAFSEEKQMLSTKIGEERFSFFEKNKLPIIANEEIVGSLNSNYKFGSEFIRKFKTLVSGKGGKFVYYFEKDSELLKLKDFNNLLMDLVEAEKFDVAEKLFQEAQIYDLILDSRTFSTIIKCFCKKCEPHEAKQVLDQMIDKGFTPNVVTFTMVISSFCVRGRVKKAFEVYELMGRIGCEPNIQTYNCLMKGLCYVGKFEEAYKLLMEIKKSSIKLDIYSYNAVMDGFCKVGRSDEGMELLEEALEDGLKPNVVTFNALFNGYSREGRPLEGIKLLKSMKERYCPPDCVNYNTLLHGLLKWGKVMTARKVYKEIIGIGLEIDERIMNTLLRGLCRRSWTNEELSEDVEDVFERIKNAGFTPYPETHCLVIQTLAIRGETDKALATLNEMIRNGNSPTLITFNVVIRALCNEGRVDDATLVMICLSEIGKIPGGTSYRLLIKECIRQGRVVDSCTLYAAALKQGVSPKRPSRKMLEAGSMRKSFSSDIPIQF
ncbi:Pentatricopeptide repeat-containing protein [Thalictrum thalictroides]|uniref:Pentatricopeptide repeat-containing protein n=1 Tax=Thalictrum thalictroides TaxID=46969 RepID=A0A7J6VYF8_THATH|nr:Pentatricopeptide repeat-containing protein [Thalictrum thalictroides]